MPDPIRPAQGRPRKTAPDPVLVLFGQRVHRERLARGWGQRELSLKAGVKRDTISRYESGAREPGIVYAMRVAVALGTTLDALLAEPVCAKCDGHPEAGFICGTCGRGGEAP